jgi:pyruvate dehydrogenase E2 component (dihydrolipoamide acetyltransferase)
MVYEFRLPDLGEGIHEGEIRKWLVKEGDSVKEHQPIAEVETDKAVVEIPSPRSGTVARIHFPEGSAVRVGDVMMTISVEGELPGKPLPAISPVKKRIAKGATGAVGELEEAEGIMKLQEAAVKAPVSASKALPSVRKLAKDLGVDITKLSGTGPEGRILEQDVRAFAQKPAPVRASRVAFEQFGRVLRMPLRGVRKAAAVNLANAFRTTVPVTHMDEADVTELVVLREKKKKLAVAKGYPLTYLPFIAKAVVIALKEHPFVNSSLDDSSGEIVIKQHYGLGIAIDTAEGLVVPVIKGCDQKSILDIAKELHSLAGHARNRELKIEDMQGGTFTITNVGSFGGTYATPVINWPECAILATGAIKDRAVVKDGAVVVRKILPLSLTFDHRIIDGAEAARFVNDLKKHLEDPELMLVEAF